MASSTTTVTGRYLAPNGVAQASNYIKFRLINTGVDDDVTPEETYARKPVEAVTDASGDYSISLWVNGDSDIQSVYEVKFPDGETGQFIIPTAASGGTIDIATLLSTYNVESSPQQSTVLAQSVDRTNHIGGPDAMNGERIAWDADEDTYTVSTVNDRLDFYFGGVLELSLTGTKAGILDDVATGGTTARDALDLGTADSPTFANLTATTKVNTTDVEATTSAGVTLSSSSGTTCLTAGAGGGANVTTADGFTVTGQCSVTGRTIMNGGVRKPLTTVTSTTYTALVTDSQILVDDDTAGAAVTITLMAAATAASGFELIIIKKGSTGLVTIDGSGSETINGELTQVLATQYDSIKITTDGTEWFVTEA